ncbi:hypothetical protein, partial [Mesorhizobium loti]|uniref:hypothetical protein n=1 Tax=Rhizobium loti TaxID=381 RepID=UPI000ADC52A8
MVVVLHYRLLSAHAETLCVDHEVSEAQIPVATFGPTQSVPKPVPADLTLRPNHPHRLRPHI